MCWTTVKEKNTKVKIAKKAMTVYKIMKKRTGEIYSYFKAYPYQINTVNLECDFGPRQVHHNVMNIFKGYHSYYAGSIIKWFKGTMFFIILPSRGKIYLNPPFNNPYAINTQEGSVIIVKCIIPKGSIYYKNEHDEIVSNQIIITDDIIEGQELITRLNSCIGDATFTKVFKANKKI